MSQFNVERIVGMLSTDEALRRRFIQDPGAVLRDMIESGLELNPFEVVSLARLDPAELARFAGSIHPCLQKADLHASRRGTP